MLGLGFQSSMRGGWGESIPYMDKFSKCGNGKKAEEKDDVAVVFL